MTITQMYSLRFFCLYGCGITLLTIFLLQWFISFEQQEYDNSLQIINKEMMVYTNSLQKLNYTINKFSNIHDFFHCDLLYSFVNNTTKIDHNANHKIHNKSYNITQNQIPKQLPHSSQSPPVSIMTPSNINWLDIKTIHHVIAQTLVQLSPIFYDVKKEICNTNKWLSNKNINNNSTISNLDTCKKNIHHICPMCYSFVISFKCNNTAHVIKIINKLMQTMGAPFIIKNINIWQKSCKIRISIMPILIESTITASLRQAFSTNVKMQLNFSGIYHLNNQWHIIINGKSYKCNDRIGPWIIKKIINNPHNGDKQIVVRHMRKNTKKIFAY